MVALVGVSKVYGEGEGEVAAVSDVSVDLGETDYTAIMGPSGCGKSTLLSMAGGLLRPDSGAVFSGGTDVFALDDEELHAFRRKSVGYVFQEFNLISICRLLRTWPCRWSWMAFRTRRRWKEQRPCSRVLA